MFSCLNKIQLKLFRVNTGQNNMHTCTIKGRDCETVSKRQSYAFKDTSSKLNNKHMGLTTDCAKSME
jgi:hypothetical protein